MVDHPPVQDTLLGRPALRHVVGPRRDDRRAIQEARMPRRPRGSITLKRRGKEHPPASRPTDSCWRTAITQIAPNTILIRGYPVDELMGRLSFAEAVYLILRGELPTPSIGKLFGAALVSSLDHGVTPPSTLAARHVATTGAPLRACVAAGVLGFGIYHGGDIETCMRFLQGGLARVREGASYPEAASAAVRPFLSADKHPPGFGHRIHTSDPRATRLLQMAHELELDGEHVQLIRTIERFLAGRPDADRMPLPLNVDGAIAAVCGDMGFEPELANALFMIARIPGLVAHANEERARQRPMRQINPQESLYDGPQPRRLPETRK
jgi:citrate synthase